MVNKRPASPSERSPKRTHMLRSATVDVATVADRYHGNDKNVVIDGVDDAVVPYPHSQTGTSLKRPGPWWPRILPEQRNRPSNAVAILMIDLPQSTNCGRAQFDLVTQVQPKSAFT